jgi:group I intron endonuclease
MLSYAQNFTRPPFYGILSLPAAANAERQRSPSSPLGVADEATPLRCLVGFAGPEAGETKVSVSCYGVIYVVTNLVNRKQYVGLTTANNPEYYCKGHIRGALNGAEKYLYNAIRKHGAEAFIFEIIWSAFDKQALDDAEDFFIVEEYKSLHPDGYNLRGGGSKGKMSAKTRQRMRIIQKILKNTPESKQRAREIKLKYFAIPGNKERHASVITEAHTRPDVKERHSTGIKLSLTKPGALERKSRASIKMHADPINKKIHHDNLVTALAPKEVRDKMGRGISTARKRAEVIEKFEEYWNTPGVREAHGNLMRSIYQNDPLIKQKVLEGTVGTRWITDGIKTRRLKSGCDLPEGWKYGRLLK